MKIEKINDNKKQFLDLLLLADESHRVKNFFTDNYEHLMFNGDIQLVDMVYLRKEL